LRGAHFAEDGVDVLLGGDHHPGPAAADGAEVLGDGLQIEHQGGILANELAEFIHQEDDAARERVGGSGALLVATGKPLAAAVRINHCPAG